MIDARAAVLLEAGADLTLSDVVVRAPAGRTSAHGVRSRRGGHGGGHAFIPRLVGREIESDCQAGTGHRQLS
jgi:hypothetical protein